MNKIYLSTVVGAPSPTAVFVIEQPINKINWKNTAIKICDFLKKKNITFSKMAIIYEKKENEYDFKFVQIKNRNGVVELESNANCGNSMIASARVIYLIKENKLNDLFLKNVDTNLEVFISKNENDNYNISFNNLIGKSIDETKMFEGSEAIIINEKYGNIKTTLINVVNPYIIVNAKDFGIENEETLLSLDDTETDILDKVKKVRQYIKQKYSYDEKSEFPKIAIVLNDNNIVARTVYLDKWHKGLPITATVTIAVASKMDNSSIFISNVTEKDSILTPQGPRKIKLETDENGIILSCNIFDIKSKGEIDIFDYNEIEK